MSASLHRSITLMQEVCCRKLSSALSPYGAERLIRGGIFPPGYHYHHHVLSTRCHGCLHHSLTQMPISLLHGCLQPLLMQMPAILACADAHIIATMDACHFADAEGGSLANSTGASSWSATTTPCLLTSMRRWTGVLAPTIWGNRGSLSCVMSLLIFFGNRSSPRLIFTGWGHYLGRDSSQISTASYQCKHSLTQCGTTSAN